MMRFANTIAIGKLKNPTCRKAMLYFHPNVLSYNLAVSPTAIKSTCRSNIHLLCEQRAQEFKDVVEDLLYYASKHHKVYEQYYHSYPTTTTTIYADIEPKYDNCFKVTNFNDLIQCASMEEKPVAVRLAGDMTQFPLDPLFELIYNQLDVNSKRPIAPYDTLYQMMLVLSGAAQHSRRARLGLDYFSDLVSYMFGEFHGTFSWECNNDHHQAPPLLKDGNLQDLDMDIPSLYQLHCAGFSIRPIPCLIKDGGIRTYCPRKSVDIQIISPVDLRYRDFNFPKHSSFRGYHADALLKLARLIPDKQSFDVAMATGIIPENLQITYVWWNDHVILEAYSYESGLYTNVSMKRSKATCAALRELKHSYDRHTKRSFFREIWAFMKSNRLEFLYSSIMLLFAFVSFLQLLVGLGLLSPVQPSTVICLSPPTLSLS
ncbi:hypothetical protein BDB00DRAFT_287028 [Zychaea mexicana]|uniref:uncharacterized protein n=1 Tax=Zychaea mexicana TaxID=64656 RepID=UPI0022FDC9E8|nr:uncharacterized protein BDB00DRAFT_287028 [Zychaea mexicana]KAI9494744.1 hypothetical protein BDB00DRAFT_287028 [Zychaea mexicana]